MKLITTPLEDCFLIKPKVFEDSRGYFFESFNKKRFRELTGKEVNFVQDNQSRSSYGVLRGLHLQKGDFSQAKLVRVLFGEVLDVAVDVRPKSATFGAHFSCILNAEDRTELFIPRGFAHGFVVLSEQAEFFYKCDNYYHKNSESGIQFNDKELDIDWKIPEKDLIISEKDKVNPSFKAFKNAL